MKLHQYAIYQLKAGAETRKLRFRPYQYLKEQSIDIRVENYDQVHISGALPEDSATKIWERFLKQPPKTFKGHHALSVSDVIAYNTDGVTNCYYVDKENLVPIPGFIRLNSSSALISMETNDFKIDGVKGNWISTDEVIVDGRQFFLMQNDYYKENAAYIIAGADGKVVTDDAEGLAGKDLDKIRDYLNPKEVEQVQSQVQSQPPVKELWQKYYENGEYVRSAESGTEQNYNMIDGNANNRPGKGRPKVRVSVLAKLRQKQKEIALWSGKPAPEMSMEMENERNRK